MQDSYNNIVGSKPISLAQSFSDFAQTLLDDDTSFLPIDLDRVGTDEQSGRDHDIRRCGRIDRPLGQCGRGRGIRQGLRHHPGSLL